MNGTPHNTSARFTISHDFTPKAHGDCIPDDRMAEIVKRLFSVVPDNLEADIVRSEEQPTDKSKLWYVPSTKKLYVYNPSTSNWEETNVDAFTVCISPESDDALGRDESGCLLLDLSKKPGIAEFFDGTITSDGSGNATKTVVLNEFEDEDAAVVVMPKGDMGATARWFVSDQTATSATVSFVGLGASTNYDCKIMVIKTSLT